jgi:Baseplate J-like protein
MSAPATPVLDRRRAADVLAELVEDVPGYSAHWRPVTGGSGYALLQVLSNYCELVIGALDGAVDKGELAFLDALGIDLLPPQAARVPLVFQLADDSPIDPPLPEGSQVAAPPPPALGTSLAPAPQPQRAVPPDPIVFTTDEGIALARARLVSLYSTYPDVDAYADHSESIGTGFRLYDDLQPVTHHLYLGHDSLLALAGSADVSLDFELESDLTPGGTTKTGKPKLPKGPKLAWEYLSADGWVAFDPIDDHTYGLSHEGDVQLHKRCGPQASQEEVHGISSYWIRARMETPLPFGSKDQPSLPVVDTVRVRLALNHGDLPCDVAFVDDLRIDTTKDFQPFGPQPEVSSSFLVACDEAFKQEGARIGIDVGFTPGSNAQPSSDLALFWEYSVAPGVWQALGGLDSEFVDQTVNLTTPTSLGPSVSFLRPPDWGKVDANGEQHYWLRVRIDQGGFGGPPTYSVVDDAGNWKVVASNLPHPPMLRRIAFAYSYQIGPFVPDHTLALNGFAYDDFSDACRWGRPAWVPFSPLPDRFSAVYLGFDLPLPIGLVSLYVDVPGSGGSAFQVSPYVWEYETADGWVELAVLDETAGFARSGMIQLIGPSDAVSAPGPSGPTYWVRARTKEVIDPDPSDVGAMFMNAVWATQRKSAQGEVLGRSDGTPRQAMQTQHAPVLERQLLEVQEWHGKGREWESLFAEVRPARLRYDKDPRGTVTAVWVTWEQRPHLYSSAPHDRHYVIERSTGLVRFGDGVQAMVPPPGAPVMISYDFEGGVAGNLQPGTITQLYSGVPFVKQVGNPVDASGGVAGETVDGVRRRGPQRLKNAGRSVARLDYEWLAKEASPEVAIARCLPTTGPDGHDEPGWVTVVIVPQGTSLRPQPSQELLRRVERALGLWAPAAIAMQILVVGPTYREISVVAEVIPTDPSGAAEVEERLGHALDGFLHPVTGGQGGSGWEFGQAVELSQVVQVILRTEGVGAAPHVALVSDTDVFGDAVPVPKDALPCPGKHLLKLEVGSV